MRPACSTGFATVKRDSNGHFDGTKEDLLKMRRLLITGGCGFVGCNLADQCIRDGDSVVLFDNLSRKGTEHNLTWLQSKHAGRFAFVKGDVRDYPALRNVVAAGFDAVYHTAGQVAVTTSVTQPREDFKSMPWGPLIC